MPALHASSVQIKLGELNELIKRAETAERQAEQLTAQLAANQLATVPRLDEAVRAMQIARKVIGFGIGNLHYDDVVGWPWRALLEFIQIFETMPGIDIDDRDWASDTKSFCEGAAEREAERAVRKPGDKPLPITK